MCANPPGQRRELRAQSHCYEPLVLVEKELSRLGSSHWQRRHLGYFKPTLLSPLRKVTELVFYPLIRRCRQNLLPTQLS